MPYNLGNLIYDESVLTTRVDITGLELIANTSSLLSESSLTKFPLVSFAHESRSYSNYRTPQNGTSILTQNDNVKKGEANTLPGATDNGRCFAVGDAMYQATMADDLKLFSGSQSVDASSQLVSNDTTSVCSEQCTALDTQSGTSLITVASTCSHQSIKKSYSWDPTIASEIIEDIVSGIANNGVAVVKDSTRPVPSSLLEVSEKMKIDRHVFSLYTVPLWGFSSIRGRRPEMEDAVAALPRFFKIPRQMLMDGPVSNALNQCLSADLFGVYDGHGGSQVADYCRDRLHLALAEVLNVEREDLLTGNGACNWKERWERVLLSCFHKVDNEVGGMGTSGANEPSLVPIAPEAVGSTAVVGIICPSHIIVANCGDSRAVLCRAKVAVPLSIDHKPNREDEYERIEAAGGKVIDWGGYRVSGVLGMSRSIGDRYLRPYVIADPEMTFVPRSREDECLILASDGLWDVMTNEEVCEVARRRILLWHKKNGPSLANERGERIDPAAQDAADYLSRLALQRGSKDNISVIVVDLKPVRKFKKKTT
ncbi:protein phosphatase 2C 50 [Coffea eugenioides]|uniref:protein phosphatase 2C 50 n=1 Tax=Coffea eugenioides TaxID=49369 RepID=UPI000F60855A|nr:protein phosphatase 2C 50 [Coffea eugenioides]XP_027173336.1 protein phosphatase 2C 50 [Coffea eugenioides]